MTQKTTSIIAGIVTVLGSVAFAGTALAAPERHDRPEGRPMPAQAQRPAVIGTITAITGTTLTVKSLDWRRENGTTTPTTYTIDASKATVTKERSASTVSALAVGDAIFVQGTLNGTTVVAAKIDSNKGERSEMGERMMPGLHQAAPIGDGNPILGGTVQTVSGSTFTVTNNGSVVYTVDASKAKVSVPGTASSTVANITVGQEVMVQGTVNGSSVTASTVIAHDARPVASTTPEKSGRIAPMRAMMQKVGGFFSRMKNLF